MATKLKHTFIYTLLLTNLFIIGVFMVQIHQHQSQKSIVKSNDTAKFIFLAEIEENESEADGLEDSHFCCPMYLSAKNCFNNQITKKPTLSNNLTPLLHNYSLQSKICVFRI